MDTTNGSTHNHSTVGVVHGGEKLPGLDQLLALTGFDDVLLAAHLKSNKAKADFQVVIKPNIMVFVHQKHWKAIVTDRRLVEHLIDHIIGLGFTNVAICEARTDVSKMLRNQDVAFIANQVGYRPNGRFRIADLTLETMPYSYAYTDAKGRLCQWRDVVGKTWKDADFRITFAKAKTHEHDYLTLSIKNVYGCFPSPGKIRQYHMKQEVFDVTARSLRNLPVHFALVDAWVASDDFQGYKIAHPQPLRMLFGGTEPAAVDIEIFKRAGLDAHASRMIGMTVEQCHAGKWPQYSVVGDTNTRFADIVPWKNISQSTVESIDRAEEVYIAWGFINLKAASYVDYVMFPPKNLLYRVGVWFMKLSYCILAKLGLWARIFHR